jgi:hypothetical protein
MQSTDFKENLSLISFWIAVVTTVTFFGHQIATSTDVLSQIF